MIVGWISISRYSLGIQWEVGEVHKRTAQRCELREHTPNSLGRVDKHKITFTQRQLHPTMIGLVDLFESSKEVGQSGIISPWADLTEFSDKDDKNKFPNIKYELFDFIKNNFDCEMVTFNANTIEEFNEVLDQLVSIATIGLNYNVKSEDFNETKS